jgi:DNA ligase-associated metallophosphoesterase
LPPWDTRVTLERLAVLLRRWRPARVVALGDSFHDRTGAGRLQAHDQVRLRAMTEFARFVWVLGNHDPLPPEGMEGEAVTEWREGPLLFRHEGVVGAAAGEVCGHHHPKAHIPARGAVVTRPCFVFDGHRLMLPDLGAYTGGLDVRDQAIRCLFPRGGRVFLLGQERLFSFALAGNPARRTRPGTSLTDA